jgi:hypothetical protein
MNNAIDKLYEEISRRLSAGEDIEMLEDFPVRWPTNGAIGARVCMVTELYYPDGDKLDVRLRAASVMRHYFSLFPDELRFFMRGGENAYKKIVKRQCPDLDALVRERTVGDPPEESFGPVIYDAVEGDVRPYRIATLN